jgi:uncharacterized protein (DUF486 family)
MPPPSISVFLPTVVLLLASNIFMTVAWYGHLKVRTWPLWLAILASWGIAFFEYCLQVPANRIGYGAMTLAQLKILQEVITLVVFIGFAWIAFRSTPRWNEWVAMGLIVLAVVFTFAFGEAKSAS